MYYFGLHNLNFFSDIVLILIEKPMMFK